MTNEPKRRGRPPKSEVKVVESGTTTFTLDAVDPIPLKLKVYIYPSFGEEDKGDGGIRRVVEAQIRHLPKFGIEIVKNEEEADLIAYHATVPPAFVNRFPQKTFVALCHGLYWEEYDWGNWALKANADVMEGIRVSDAVVTCSEWVANALKRNTSRPVSVIPHGVEMDEWNGHDFIPYVLWNKTRPDPICDPRLMNEVAKKLEDIKFVSTFGEETENVQIVGKLPFNISKQAIERAGVYLCTTRETFGIGTLEAMACGIPVVAYDYAGQHEFLEHMKDSWLAPVGDVDSLAQGILWAFQNRAAVGSQARLKASKYSWEKACKAYADIFIETHKKKNTSVRTSVIVTNYNLHDYLEECLQSVADQTDKDWECIVVDDCSTNPAGIEIVKKFIEKDDRFKLIVNRNNEYLAEARNIGIRSALGRYILPLDADDLLPSGAIASLAGYLDSDRSVHVSYGDVSFIEEDGSPSDYGLGPGKSSWPYDFIFEQQIQERNLLPYSSMFRKEVWENTGGYRRRCRTAEDADFWTRASSYGFRPKKISSDTTLIYRNRANSMSRTNSANWIRWFSWAKLQQITPSGAVTEKQLPIHSLDPVRISIIIPVGPNHGKIVTDAIDSVDTQVFRNWECIVVNDTGSPLPTELPAWVRVVDTGGNKGVSAARNLGISVSRGSLFLPLDADDILQPEALHNMYKAYQESMEVVYSDFWIDEGGELTLWKADDYDPLLLTGKSRIVDNQKREGMIHAVTALTPKALWQRVGGYDESLPAWEDWDFQLALASIGACERRVSMPLFIYRRDKGFRREQNYNSMDKSKEAFLQKWGKLWESGGEQLMACSSCRSRGKTYGGAPLTVQSKASSPNSESLVLIFYDGPSLGSMTYRGNSNTTYRFGKGDKKWVRPEDVELFMNYEGFSIINEEQSSENKELKPSIAI